MQKLLLMTNMCRFPFHSLLFSSVSRAVGNFQASWLKWCNVNFILKAFFKALSGATGFLLYADKNIAGHWHWKVVKCVCCIQFLMYFDCLPLYIVQFGINLNDLFCFNLLFHYCSCFSIQKTADHDWWSKRVHSVFPAAAASAGARI